MTTCFIGHRKISYTEKFYLELKNLILYLIDKQKTDTFLFGSRSEFDSICLKAVTELKAIRPNIKRIYVRADICVFYYKYSYKLPTVKSPHSNYKVYQPDSGTKIAYTYAVTQKKKIINTVFHNTSIALK